jgi:hypothetical protein
MLFFNSFSTFMHVLPFTCCMFSSFFMYAQTQTIHSNRNSRTSTPKRSQYSVQCLAVSSSHLFVCRRESELFLLSSLMFAMQFTVYDALFLWATCSFWVDECADRENHGVWALNVWQL